MIDGNQGAQDGVEGKTATTVSNKKTVSATFGTAEALAQDLAARRAAGLKILSATDILGAPDTVYRMVDVPEWGGEVIVRSLSGTERDAFESSLIQQRGKDRVMTTLNIRAKLCALSIVDPADPALQARAFTDEQIAALGKKSAGGLSRVYNEAADLSGISEKDAEELAGNSAPAASADSSPKLP